MMPPKTLFNRLVQLPLSTGGIFLIYGFLSLLIILAYSYSLLHVARSDQLMYLAEVAGKQGFWDLTIGSLDLNRHRMFNPGDEVLYRPVLFMILGVQKYLFQYHFMFWQAIGIALHLGVVWFLLCLLLMIHRGWPAVATTALFAFMFTNMEMVVWHHINPYMFFLICMLAALSCYLKLLQKDKPAVSDFLLIILWLLLGVFTVELSNIFAVLFALGWFAMRAGFRRYCILFLIVPVLYFSISYWNAIVHPFSVLLSAIEPSRWAGNSIKAIELWLYAGLFPSAIQWVSWSRNMIHPQIFTGQTALVSLQVWTCISAFCIVVGYAIAISSRRLQLNKFYLLIAAISFIFVAGFTLIISASRGSQLIINDVLRINTYYMYIVWLFLMVGFFILIDWGKAWKTLKIFLFCSIFVFTIQNSIQLYQSIQRQAQNVNSVNVLIQILDGLVKEHGHEPEFSFYVSPDYPGNYIYSELHRRNDPPGRLYTFAEALYPAFYKAEGARYRLLAHAP